MISLVVIWLLVASYTASSRIIIVNNDGVDSAECCGNGTCPCSSLFNALQNLANNTVVIISDSVPLEKLAPMGQGELHNITITGNDVTIECNDEAAIYCASCNDITIGGITFNQCGIHSQYISGLEFVNATNIAIHNC